MATIIKFHYSTKLLEAIEADPYGTSEFLTICDEHLGSDEVRMYDMIDAGVVCWSVPTHRAVSAPEMAAKVGNIVITGRIHVNEDIDVDYLRNDMSAIRDEIIPKMFSVEKELRGRAS